MSTALESNIFQALLSGEEFFAEMISGDALVPAAKFAEGAGAQADFTRLLNASEVDGGFARLMEKSVTPLNRSVIAGVNLEANVALAEAAAPQLERALLTQAAGGSGAGGPIAALEVGAGAEVAAVTARMLAVSCAFAAMNVLAIFLTARDIIRIIDAGTQFVPYLARDQIASPIIATAVQTLLQTATQRLPTLDYTGDWSRRRRRNRKRKRRMARSVL